MADGTATPNTIYETKINRQRLVTTSNFFPSWRRSSFFHRTSVPFEKIKSTFHKFSNEMIHLHFVLLRIPLCKSEQKSELNLRCLQIARRLMLHVKPTSVEPHDSTVNLMQTNRRFICQHTAQFILDYIVCKHGISCGSAA